MISPDKSAWAEEKVYNALLKVGFEAIRLPYGLYGLPEEKIKNLIKWWGPAIQEVRNRADGVAKIPEKQIEFFWEAKECAWESNPHYNLALEAIQLGNFRKNKNCLYCVAYFHKPLILCQWAHEIDSFIKDQIWVPQHQNRTQTDNNWIVNQCNDLFPDLVVRTDIQKPERSNDPFVLVDKEVVQTTWRTPHQVFEMLCLYDLFECKVL